jgi:hypothetical protein
VIGIKLSKLMKEINRLDFEEYMSNEMEADAAQAEADGLAQIEEAENEMAEFDRAHNWD